MTSLTWNYEASHKLIACGIDAERVDRFDKYVANDEYPMTFVFSEKESIHFDKLANPATGFCAAFCSKEAFFKAVSRHYNFPECELFLTGNDVWQKIKLSSNLCEEFKIDSAIARINFIYNPSYLECMAAVYVFKDI